MILMIYNRKLCREFLLPSLHNSDYEILLDEGQYGFPRGIVLSLEATEEGWYLNTTEQYHLICNNAKVSRSILRGDIILTVAVCKGETFKVLAVEAGRHFGAVDKFSLSGQSRITIGKAEENTIRYDYRGLISGLHAELTRGSDGWYLVDRSTNGVFSERGRLQGASRLQFGDHFYLFGLHLVYLGDCLAVASYYGSLKIRADILRTLVFEEKSPGKEVVKPYTEQVYFNRSPRNLPSLYTDEFEIEGPPDPKELKQRPWFLVVGPSFTMAIPMLLGCALAIWGSSMSGMASGIFMYTGLITAIGSAGLGAFWAATNMKYSRNEAAEEENRRFNAYSNYLLKVTEFLKKKYDYNRSMMEGLYPPAADCAKISRFDTGLWNRNHTHEDFLFHRLGTGEIPFQIDIRVPKEKFTLQNDSLKEKPGNIKKQFETLFQVPVGISFREHQLIGLVGGSKRKGAEEIMHSIVAEFAATHCYTDVKFVFLYDENSCIDLKNWDCMRWFPHVWSEDRQTRYMAADEVERRDVLFELSNVLRARMQGGDGRSRNGIAKPWYLIFVSDPGILEGELLTRYIYDPLPVYGMTTFLMSESVEQLPNVCEEIIENEEYFHGFYNLLEGSLEKKPVRLDRVSVDALERMGRTLSGIRVNETETTNEIPSELDFFSMYGVRTLEDFQVRERWRKNRTYNSMKALIGKKSGNADCYLDVHEKYHGPHGLIAGTTGSGKSETLQTYILSLALNFSPEDVSFFIIDFKGGGMANLFAGLPHMAGQISNLSGGQIHRAMISIKSENVRRQKLFSAHGVNNINLYTRLYKNREAKEAVPHLFIIIDEFAELKREEPDFMRELISVAQVGRSLGVHLILATQKPSGTVDDNIWSNSRFRLCLRVQDRQDSTDMLHKPDAAFITQTGRGYLQVGNDEIYEQFQTGYSGAHYAADAGSDSSGVMMLTRTGKQDVVSGRLPVMESEIAADRGKIQDVTQLEAVVDYLAKMAREMGYEETRQLWMPVLPEKITLEQTAKYALLSDIEESTGKWQLSAVVGVYDDPWNQRQEPFAVDFARDGHVAVCGSVVSGKSTFLQTLVYSLITRRSPAEVQCYILDFGSHLLTSFAYAPHIGGIVCDGQEDRLGKFIHMLVQMMDERRQLLSGGSYSQYIQAYGRGLPAVLIVIDNLGSMREKSSSRYDDVLLRLGKEGAGYGIFLAVSAAGYGISEIPGRLADNIKTVISLEQGDKYKYMEVMRETRLQVFPEAGIKGRGIANVDGRILEFQTGLCLDAEDDFSRGQILEKECREMSAKWGGILPRSIPEIPENPVLSQLEGLDDYKKMIQSGDWLPVAYEMETASVFGTGLKNTYCYTISGRPHTGKTNVLKLLLYAAAVLGGKLCVIETAHSSLKKTADECGAEYLETTETVFEFFRKLTPVFVERNKKKREMIEQGKEEDEIYEEMKKETPIFVFLDDLKEFFELIYGADEKVGNMSGFMENIMEKGSLHRIYFYGCLTTEDAISLTGYKAYRSFTGYKKGMHLGGNLNAQKLFNFQNINYAELSRTAKKGLGYAADEEDETSGIRIVLPLARRDPP